MNTDSVKKASVIHVCDFCKTQGSLNQTIFNHEGWYYCQNCLIEIPKMTKNRGKPFTSPVYFEVAGHWTISNFTCAVPVLLMPTASAADLDRSIIRPTT